METAFGFRIVCFFCSLPLFYWFVVGLCYRCYRTGNRFDFKTDRLQCIVLVLVKMVPLHSVNLQTNEKARFPHR